MSPKASARTEVPNRRQKQIVHDSKPSHAPNATLWTMLSRVRSPAGLPRVQLAVFAVVLLVSSHSMLNWIAALPAERAVIEGRVHLLWNAAQHRDLSPDSASHVTERAVDRLFISIVDSARRLVERPGDSGAR